MSKPLPSVSTVKKAWQEEFFKRVDEIDGDKAGRVPLDALRVARFAVSPEGRRIVSDTAEELAVRKLARHAQRDLQRAADRGTAIHSVMEAMACGLPLPTFGDQALREDIAEYYRTASAVIEQLNPQPIIVERAVFNRTAGVVGTIDMGAEVTIGGARLVAAIDWKTRGADSGHACYELEACQVVAYATADYMIDEVDGAACRRRLPRFDCGFVVSMKPDGDFGVFIVDIKAGRPALDDLVASFTAKKRGLSVARKAVGRLDLSPPTPPQPRPMDEIQAWRKAKGLGRGVQTPPDVLRAINVDKRTAADLLAEEEAGMYAKVLRHRIDRLRAIDTVRALGGAELTPIRHLMGAWPDGAPSPKTGEAWTPAQEADIAQSVAVLETVFADLLPFWPELDCVPVDKTEEPAPKETKPERAFNPDDTEDADPAALEALRSKILAMPLPARQKLAQWTAEAGRGRRSVSLTERPSVRRFEIARAMVDASAIFEDDTDDEIVRTLIHAATGEELPIAVTTGVGFGAIESPKTARHLASLFDTWATGGHALSFDAQDRPVLVAV